MEICTGCGRNFPDKAACLTCPTEPQEHRGSRMPNLLRECAADPLFADAAFRGFAPLTEDAKVAFKEKAGIYEAVIDKEQRAS